jgi:hypothetical protein
MNNNRRRLHVPYSLMRHILHTASTFIATGTRKEIMPITDQVIEARSET